MLILLAAAALLAVATPPSPAQQAAPDAEAALRNAQNAFNQQKWEQAIRAFEDFRLNYPQHPQAVNAPFNIAEAQIQLGEFEKARLLLDEYQAKAPDDEHKALALFRVGECSFFLNDYERAQRDLELFRSQYPDHEKDSYAIGYLGDILLDAKAPQAAEAKKLFQDAYNKYKAAKSNDPQRQKELKYTAEECRLGLGRALALGREIPAALSTFESMAGDKNSPLAANARAQLGKLYYEQQRYDEAIRALKPFEKAAQNPSRNWGLYWLARTYADQSSQMADAAGETAALHSSLAAFKAINLTKETADEPPISAIAYFWGETYRAAGQFDKALERYKKTLYDYPESEWADDAFLGMMRLALDQEDYRTVTVTYYATATNQFSDSPLYPYMDQLVGQSFLKSEKYEDARSTFSALTQRYTRGARPEDEAALPDAFINDNWLFLALSEIGLGHADKALDALKNTKLTGAPGNGDFEMAVSAAKANAYVLLGKYQEAIAPLQEYLKVRGGDSDAPRYYKLLALCQIMGKQPDAAKKTVEKLRSLKLDAIGGEEVILKAEQELAVAAAEQREKELARTLYTYLTFPQNPRSYIDFGEEGLRRLSDGRPPVDEETASPAASDLAQEQDAYVLFKSGLQAEEEGEILEALEYFEKTCTQHKTSAEAPQALLAMGRIYDRMQKDKDAAKLLKQLVRDYPEFPQLDLAWYRLAWTLIESNDPDGGQKAFLHVVEDFPKSALWADAAYRVAEYQSAGKNRDAANKLLDDILRQNENGGSTKLLDHVLYLRGQNAFAQKNYTTVEKCMERLIEETPQSPLILSAHYWLAETAYKNRQFDVAQERFSELEELAAGRTEPWLPIVPLRQAQILAWNKQWNEAARAAQQIKRDYPNFERMHEVDYLLGRYYTQAAKFSEARNCFQDVIDADRGRHGESAAMSQWMIGEIYFRQGEHAKAIDAYNQVSTQYSYPHWQSAALLQIGKCYLQLGDSKRAGAALNELLKHFADSPYAQDAEKLLKTAIPGSAANKTASSRYR